MNFITRLMHYASKNNNLIAVQTEQIILSYSELYEQVLISMDYLLNQGISSNSVVGITIADELEHLIMTLALFGVGASQVTLPTHDSLSLQNELAERVGMTDIIVVEKEETITISNYNIIRFSYTKLNQVKNKDIQVFEIDMKERPEGTIFFKTSGTTSRTNIIPFTESQILLQAEEYKEYSEEALLRLASIEHNNSKRHRLYVLLNGGINVFKPVKNFDIVEYVLEKKISWLLLSSIHASSLLKHQYAHKLSNVKISMGGSAVPYPLRRAIEENITKKLYLRYSTNESALISIAKPYEHDEDASSGVVLQNVILEIVDRNDEPLPFGCTGEVRVKTAGMAYGYLDNPEQTKKRFKNGWFYPGDLAYIRSDGHLCIQGRADDMIIMNSLNIYPAEIEKILEAYPGIKTAAAFPIESTVHGQIPVAAVELYPDSIVSVQEIQSFAREALSLRAPRKIIILDELPRNSQGKILKREIVTMFSENGVNA